MEKISHKNEEVTFNLKTNQYEPSEESKKQGWNRIIIVDEDNIVKQIERLEENGYEIRLTTVDNKTALLYKKVNNIINE